MRILTCSVRRVRLHEERSSTNGFTLCKEGCHLEEGSAAPQGLCEYVFSLKSTVPVVSFVPCKEPWLCSIPGLRCRWSLVQRNSIPQLTTTGFYSSRSDKSTKIKFKKRPRLQLPPESSFWGHQPQSQSNTPGPEAVPCSSRAGTAARYGGEHIKKNRGGGGGWRRRVRSSF